MLIDRNDLRRLLEEVLRSTGERRCDCPAPAIFYAERLAGGPNWRVGFCAPCAQGCDEVLQGLARELAERYELRSPR